MHEVSKERFLELLKPGDIGVNCSRNFFATLQNWYRKKFNEGQLRASHGFFVKNPPIISEANGVFISNDDAKIIKFIGNSTKAWVFRYKALTPQALEEMLEFVDAAEAVNGHYSVLGIWDFAKNFFAKVLPKPKDEPGVFCTEYTSRIINAAHISYIENLKAYEITPSYQLNWFMEKGTLLGWILAAYYDGAGKYLVADEVISPQLYPESDSAKGDLPTKSA